VKKNISDRYVRLWPRDLLHIEDQQSALKDKLTWPGIYILYRGSVPYYVGKAHNVYRRLCDHSNIDTRYGNLWDMFSAFAVSDPDARNDVEAILIQAMPTANGSRPHPFKRIRLPKKMQDAFFEHKNLGG
jgi:hypothetical protein